MFNWLRARHQSYNRGGYRWHELRIGRRRWMTWQLPFFRSYSIAWSQEQIDRDVARALTEVNAGLVGKAELTRRFLSEERYDGG